MARDEFYKWVKVAGMVSYIPAVLAAGPLAGYFIGDFLINKFALPAYVLFASLIIFSAASIMEAIRIIKLISKMDKRL